MWLNSLIVILEIMELFDECYTNGDDDAFMLDLTSEEKSLLDDFRYEKSGADVNDYCHTFENQDLKEQEYIEEKIIHNQESSTESDTHIKSSLAIDSSIGSTGSIVVKINQKRSAPAAVVSTLSNKSARAVESISSSSNLISLASDTLIEASDKMDRLNFLMTVPVLTGQYMNSSNEEALKTMLISACEPFCVLISPTTGGKIVSGPENIANFFTAIPSAVPDYVTTSRRPNLSHRVISTVHATSSTHYANLPSMAMINFLQTDIDADPSFIAARDTGLSLMRAGKSVRMVSQSVCHLVLNKERTHIEKIMFVKKQVSVCEVPHLKEYLSI